MEIKGHVHEVGQTTQVSDTFKKRDLVVIVAENPQYPEYISFQAVQDKVNLFDNLSVGQEVEVSFNLRGRPWTNKEGVTTYFNTLQAWKVTAGVQTATISQPMPAPVDISGGADDDDGLPF